MLPELSRYDNCISLGSFVIQDELLLANCNKLGCVVVNVVGFLIE